MTTRTEGVSTNQAKFQVLLRRLFQFDSADLDFGIYRIMNHKRDAVERFVSEQLPAFVASELGSGPLAQQAQAAADLAEAAANIRAVAPEAIDADGVLARQFHGSDAGRKYLAAQALVSDASRSRDSVEAAIYNHLYSFFNRYYDEGDFISKRRYSRNQRYAIPYNGEEVYLHWANSDQYYVKTDEYFRNYDWKAPNGVSVHFRIRNADVEQNNVKGDRRFFIPLVSDTVWDKEKATVTVPFEYRPLSDSETTKHGNRDQQNKIIAEAVSEIPQELQDNSQALAALTGDNRRDEQVPVSRLEHHLRRYVQRNNSDFFIHKDLAGFLNRELDFYLKNEVLNLDNLAVAGQEMSEGWFQQMRLTKTVGGKIIDFLAQIEDFQKMLWEKRKFVTETQYCITLGNIDAGLYPDILANEAQWQEWREILDVDGTDRSAAFLQDHSTLPLDTRHFDHDFTDRLLASFDDLEGIIDGLLVRSENWQALRFLLDRYAGEVRCVYIDPPYNTGSGDFAYKDSYRHSSWLSMMIDRANLSHDLMHVKGSLYCQIDHLETHRVRELFDNLFTFQREVIWDIQVLSGFKTIAPNWIRGHETVLFYTKTNKYTFNKLRQPHTERYEQMFNRVDEHGRKFMIAHGTTRYWDDVKDRGKPIGDVWSDIMSFQQQPTAAERIGFDTQKPEKLLERIIAASTSERDIILDYFGGSGTTVACAQKLNRRYILCEVGEHFETITVPRMKRVLYGETTSVSKSSGYKGGGGFKYISLESYEDALDSIEFDEPGGQMPLAEESDEYLLKYMLRWETKDSRTLLNPADLTSPFSYRLRVHANGEKRERKVDPPETFNYLLGLKVQKRKVKSDAGRRYLVFHGETRAAPGREVCVIWRETEGWTEDDFARDRDFVARKIIKDHAGTVYVNGGSAIPGAKPIEPIFKARMFSGVNS